VIARGGSYQYLFFTPILIRWLNTISLACSVDERNALVYPYLLKNAHLGYFSSAQNPHCFELDQLYNTAKDLEEHNNIFYDVVGTPNPSDN